MAFVHKQGSHWFSGHISRRDIKQPAWFDCKLAGTWSETRCLTSSALFRGCGVLQVLGMGFGQQQMVLARLYSYIISVKQQVRHGHVLACHVSSPSLLLATRQDRILNQQHPDFSTLCAATACPLVSPTCPSAARFNRQACMLTHSLPCVLLVCSCNRTLQPDLSQLQLDEKLEAIFGTKQLAAAALTQALGRLLQPLEPVTVTHTIT